MAIGSLNIPYEEIIKSYKDIMEKKKQKVCKILPDSTFFIREDGSISYFGLVCGHRMGGESTGVAAKWCKNCKTKNKKG
jgi:hypothetical protein